MNAKKQIDKAKLIKWSALIKEQSESGPQNQGLVCSKRYH